ncbi:hypothetical protein BT63DRAFT_457429 [Microthyrium microscopicum]|uniref:Uncharacterized protein n=1 Tax=Microthyrium microscopicum TaxID=703497 RepID=A0A6A6U4W1_9PEZI|nr:hypothetical protein BT63DRAFT_457429 [Microthyrium microscopicum]
MGASALDGSQRTRWEPAHCARHQPPTPSPLAPLARRATNHQLHHHFFICFSLARRALPRSTPPTSICFPRTAHFFTCFLLPPLFLHAAQYLALFSAFPCRASQPSSPFSTLACIRAFSRITPCFIIIFRTSSPFFVSPSWPLHQSLLARTLRISNAISWLLLAAHFTTPHPSRTPLCQPPATPQSLPSCPRPRYPHLHTFLPFFEPRPSCPNPSDPSSLSRRRKSPAFTTRHHAPRFTSRLPYTYNARYNAWLTDSPDLSDSHTPPSASEYICALLNTFALWSEPDVARAMRINDLVVCLSRTRPRTGDTLFAYCSFNIHDAPPLQIIATSCL